jgi:hypothetical protein
MLKRARVLSPSRPGLETVVDVQDATCRNSFTIGHRPHVASRLRRHIKTSPAPERCFLKKSLPCIPRTNV